MILTVHVEGWQLEEDGRILRVGDDFSGLLFFEEAGRWLMPPESLQQIAGRARPIAWDWHEAHRHPVQVEVGSAALYWSAPEHMVGDVRLTGGVNVDSTDAPEDFPATHGVIRRIRMEWREYVREARSWQFNNDQARYEDVPRATCLPTASSSRTWNQPQRRYAMPSIARWRRGNRSPMAHSSSLPPTLNRKFRWAPRRPSGRECSSTSKSLGLSADRSIV